MSSFFLRKKKLKILARMENIEYAELYNNLSLAKIIVSHDNPTYSSIDGVLYSKDKPLIPFVDTFHGDETDADMEQWRSQVIYINDLNTPVRWDRFTNADPPDAWTRNYIRDAAGTGGLWLAAPNYNDERSETNNLFDKSGRLVAAGNNTVFVWDEEHGRLVFDVVTGRKIDYGKQDG